MKNSKVGIVVVTYNRLALLKEVIEALRLQTYDNYQIVVVNNGSTDDTERWLKEQDDVYTIMQTNLGGAGGFFTGMKYIAENGFGYCWIMDDDVICQPNALEELYNAYQAKTDIGFVCSKVVGINGCPMNTPMVDTRATENGYACYFDLVDKQMIKVSNATFVSVFLSTNTIYEVGLPYKEYFIWGDDIEYTTRISKNKDCYLACKSVVLHKRAMQGSLSFSTETNPNRLKNYVYMFRNLGYNELKNANLKSKIKWWIKRVIDVFSYLFKLDFMRFSIMLKSSIALLLFHPSIKYPER